MTAKNLYCFNCGRKIQGSGVSIGRPCGGGELFLCNKCDAKIIRPKKKGVRLEK